MKPIAIFGEVSDELKNKIFELRKKVHELEFDSGEIYLHTVPHLTLAVNSKFEGEVKSLKPNIENLNLKKFSLKVEDFIVVDNNIAVKFDNSISIKLAKEVAFALKDFNFEPVETYLMKQIRSTVKPEFQEKAKQMLKEIIPNEIEIIKLSAAGGNLEEKDSYWSINLND